MVQAAAIDVEGVSKHFARPLPRLRRLLKRQGPEVVRALTGVSLRVEPGEIFGLVGRNGQGKTTLIKSTCGLIEPSAGQIRVFGYDTVRELREVKRRVGLVSADERSFYYRLSGRENLTFFARLQGLDDAELVRRIDVLAGTFELEPVLERPFQEYSSGNKQRLAIVRALLPDPPLLLLDEPTRSLDPLSAEGLRRALRAWAGSGSQEKTVLITTHNLSEIEQLCERVAILSRGQVIECETLAALRQKYARGEAVELVVRGPIDDALLASLRRELGQLECELLADGRSKLRIERQAGDDRLQRLIEHALRARLAIVGCATQPFGLMQVLEIVESRARGA
ncbi:MAG: Efflux transporter, ATP-binding protein [Myxococcaceae bacterium]|nr:Efflux transporter, ATP-binding protein [Myxococcaceae bacterium]